MGKFPLLNGAINSQKQRHLTVMSSVTNRGPYYSPVLYMLSRYHKMFVKARPETVFTYGFLLTLLEGQTLPDIPHFKKFVLISSPLLKSSEKSHKTFEILGQNGVLSFMETYVLSIGKSEFSAPFGNVCRTSY